MTSIFSVRVSGPLVFDTLLVAMGVGSLYSLGEIVLQSAGCLVPLLLTRFDSFNVLAKASSSASSSSGIYFSAQ